MVKIIDLPMQKPWFEKDQSNRFSARLAKFKLQKGDILRFYEIDEDGRKTGRFFEKSVKDFHKIHKALKYWKYSDLIKYGFYIIEMKTNSSL